MTSIHFMFRSAEQRAAFAEEAECPLREEIAAGEDVWLLSLHEVPGDLVNSLASTARKFDIAHVVDAQGGRHRHVHPGVLTSCKPITGGCSDEPPEPTDEDLLDEARAHLDAALEVIDRVRQRGWSVRLQAWEADGWGERVEVSSHDLKIRATWVVDK